MPMPRPPLRDRGWVTIGGRGEDDSQNPEDVASWVPDYRVTVSVDGKTWNAVDDEPRQGGPDRVFLGNAEATHDKAVRTLPSVAWRESTEARYLRILIDAKRWKHSINEELTSLGKTTAADSTTAKYYYDQYTRTIKSKLETLLSSIGMEDDLAQFINLVEKESTAGSSGEKRQDNDGKWMTKAEFKARYGDEPDPRTQKPRFEREWENVEPFTKHPFDVVKEQAGWLGASAHEFDAIQHTLHTFREAVILLQMQLALDSVYNYKYENDDVILEVAGPNGLLNRLSAGQSALVPLSRGKLWCVVEMTGKMHE
eukprot:gene57600-biopygen54947